MASRASPTFAFLAMGLHVVLGFNLDLRTAVVHRGPQGTMFGFDVAQHKDNELAWLLVGAPKAQTDQPGVDTGGAVYRCSPEAVGACQQIPFDRTGSNRILVRGTQEQSDEKSHQWFGATVHSSGVNGMVVACAPRYVYFSTNLRRRDPVGACWVAKSSFQGFQEYTPCRTSAWGYHRQGSCQAGISATISKDGRRMFMGAVGSWYWQGQVFSQDLLSQQALHSTAESPAYDDDSYLGYSTATGEFSGDSDPDVAVGMPRGNNLTGKVVLYNLSLHPIHNSLANNLTGEQIGSYFGHCLCVADINGDKLDDIIVGAPLYTDLKAKDGSFEKGRVYIYYQSKNHKFKNYSQLDGTESKGRFGLALTSLSDVNQDGYEDIAVGAPYGGDDGRGLVFIYHGSKNGIQPKASQVISAGQFGDPMLRTFGFSLSAGVDMDNNEYPDLLVGAYEADQTVFMRARPVVTVKSTLKIVPDKINLNEKGCSLKDNTFISCVVVSLCLEYSGVGVESEMALWYETKLDATKQKSRVFFLTKEQSSAENITVKLRKQSEYCSSIFVYIKNNIRDKLTPIAIQMTINLVNKERGLNELIPILDQNVATNFTKYANIQKNCGKDNICIPDLKLSVKKNMNFYLIGTKEKLELEVIIANRGEDAFEAMFFLEMPLDVSYVNINKTKSGSHVSCIGASPEKTGINLLSCDIGNPLQTNKTLQFTVIMAPSKMTSAVSDFIFELSVNSTNVENATTIDDNFVNFTLPIQVEAELKISGRSEPQLLTYNETDYQTIGPEVVHTYEVSNSGPSLIYSTEIRLLWPSRTLANKHLLYLVDKPRIVGKAHCLPVPDFDPEKLKIKLEPRRGTPINASENQLDEYSEKSSRTLATHKSKRSLKKELDKELVCGPTLCTKINCTITNLTKGEPVIFILRSRVWMETIREMGIADLQISSKIVANVTSLPYKVNPDYLGIQTHSVSVQLFSESADRDGVPLWIIILAICGGLLLLGLLVLLLWRLGFFKRKRPQEKEPLYRPEKNGYQLAKDDAAL